MKTIRNIVLLALIVCTGHVFAQQLTVSSEITLPDSITQAQTEWADLNNDGLTDILLLVTTDTHKYYAMYIKGDTVNTPLLLDTTQALVTLDAYRLIDYNRDNQLDIVTSGTAGTTSHTIVYQNKGNFEFDEITLPLPAFETLRLADLDNDGMAEWIVSGLNDNGPYMNILHPNTTGPWTIVNDTFKIQTTALEITDIDNNGILDLFISGTVSADSLFTGFLINNGDFSFTPAGYQPWAGTAARSDFNADGNADIIFTGHNADGNNISKRFDSKAQGHIIADNRFTLQNGYTFAADLNSDGIPDFNYLGRTTSYDTLNIVAYTPNDYDTLPHHNVASQRFGDLEHDGDLDLAQIILKTPIVIRIFENQPVQKNKAPGKPLNAIGLPVFNRQFLYWQKPHDDSTPVASITYDLFVYADASPLQVGEFDLLLDRRLTITPGNNGTSNFRLLKNIAAPTLQFSVQAVDNALHAGATCTGSGSASCTTTSAKQISACSGETLSLNAQEPALWFSFSHGYLGTSQILNLQPTRPDTVFYFQPQQPRCPALNAWVISINNDTIKHISETIYSCKDATIILGTSPDWQNTQWSSLLAGDLGTTDSIQYHVTGPDTVSVTASNGMGCTIVHKTGIAISTPALSLEAEAYRILKGQSVQLQATGAQTYQWSPPEGLDRTNTATPVASPLTTTAYTVTGYDTLGCTTKATVTVWVESTAFVPSLFSPNDDGSNDRLKVYGLAPADGFTFKVFSRQGSLVFKTNSIDEIVQAGWDGTTNGVRQPGGVYYWEVDGTSTSGSTLLLNGKKSGFVVLIR